MGYPSPPWPSEPCGRQITAIAELAGYTPQKYIVVLDLLPSRVNILEGRSEPCNYFAGTCSPVGVQAAARIFPIMSRYMNKVGYLQIKHTICCVSTHLKKRKRYKPRIDRVSVIQAVHRCRRSRDLQAAKCILDMTYNSRTEPLTSHIVLLVVSMQLVSLCTRSETSHLGPAAVIERHSRTYSASASYCTVHSRRCS